MKSTSTFFTRPTTQENLDIIKQNLIELDYQVKIQPNTIQVEGLSSAETRKLMELSRNWGLSSGLNIGTKTPYN